MPKPITDQHRVFVSGRWWDWDDLVREKGLQFAQGVLLSEGSTKIGPTRGLPGTVLVLTDKGLLRLDALVEENVEKVYTSDGWQSCTAHTTEPGDAT